jgi:hypothetical protein
MVCLYFLEQQNVSALHKWWKSTFCRSYIKTLSWCVCPLELKSLHSIPYVGIHSLQKEDIVRSWCDCPFGIKIYQSYKKNLTFTVCKSDIAGLTWCVCSFEKSKSTSPVETVGIYKRTTSVAHAVSAFSEEKN